MTDSADRFQALLDAANRSPKVAALFLVTVFTTFAVVPEVLRASFGELGQIAGKIVGIVSMVLLFIAPLLLLSHVWKHAPKGRVSEWTTGLLTLGVTAGLLLLPGYFRQNYGPCVPGALFERGYYESRVYVIVASEDAPSIQHRVPATISAGYGYDEDEEHSYSWREYTLYEIQIPDGDRLEFQDNPPALKLNEPVDAYDDNGDSWTIEITDQAAR